MLACRSGHQAMTQLVVRPNVLASSYLSMGCLSSSTSGPTSSSTSKSASCFSSTKLFSSVATSAALVPSRTKPLATHAAGIFFLRHCGISTCSGLLLGLRFPHRNQTRTDLFSSSSLFSPVSSSSCASFARGLSSQASLCATVGAEIQRDSLLQNVVVYRYPPTFLAREQREQAVSVTSANVVGSRWEGVKKKSENWPKEFLVKLLGPLRSYDTLRPQVWDSDTFKPVELVVPETASLHEVLRLVEIAVPPSSLCADSGGSIGLRFSRQGKELLDSNAPFSTVLNKPGVCIEVLSPSGARQIPVNGGQPILDGELHGLHWMDRIRLFLLCFTCVPVILFYFEVKRYQRDEL
eukprot:gb/GEZN01011463.1/.p1 GENE.gb/GEZN01011463.1/~~gb/GEZN01011463.1/.p1  ORF type:complete len:351 (+),score=56.10 gb/GEZN01011463.1/:58-1110(+)